MDEAGIVVMSGSDEVVWAEAVLELVVDVGIIVVVGEAFEVGDVELVAYVVLVGDVDVFEDIVMA